MRRNEESHRISLQPMGTKTYSLVLSVTDDEELDEEKVEDAEETETEKQEKRSKALKRMMLFPLILIIGFLPGTIRRICESVTGHTAPLWLVLLHIVSISLIPCFDALVYGFTKDVRLKYAEICKS